MTEKHAHAPVLAAVSGTILLAYANSLEGGLVMDSGMLIGENPALRSADWENILFLLTHDYWQPMATGGLYRPLTTLSYLFNYAVLGNGAQPLGYHVVNLFLHLGCALLVYAVTWHFTRRAWSAGLAAAIFGLHPVATEAVTNVVGRADLLSALGVLGGLLVHIRGGSRPRPLHLFGIATAGFVAVFSKENGLVLPAVLLLYDVLFRRVVWRSQAVLVPLLVLYAMNRYWVHAQGLPPYDTLPIDNPLVEAGFLAGRLTALKVVVLQLGLLFFPLWLSADYSYDQIAVLSWPFDSPGDALTILSVAVLAGIGWWAVRLRDLPQSRFFVALFFLVLLPTANLLTLVGTIMAERFLYLPLAAFAGFAGVTADRAARDSGGRLRAALGRLPNRSASIVAVLVLAGLGVRTHLRNRDWRDELGLWTSTVRTVPASAKAHHGYAGALFAADPSHANIDAVIAASERAVAIRGDYMLALLDLGIRYVLKGDLLASVASLPSLPSVPSVASVDRSATSRPWYEKAVVVLERARALERADTARFIEKMSARGRRPEEIPVYGNVQVYRSLAQALAGAGRTDDALEAYRHALFLQPMNAQIYVDVSAAFARAQRLDEAAVVLFESLTIDPANADTAQRLGTIYQLLGVHGALVGDAHGRSHIDVAHPTVRGHRCRALQRLTETLTEARSPAAAARVRELAARDGCA